MRHSSSGSSGAAVESRLQGVQLHAAAEMRQVACNSQVEKVIVRCQCGEEVPLVHLQRRLHSCAQLTVSQPIAGPGADVPVAGASPVPVQMWPDGLGGIGSGLGGESGEGSD